MKIGDWFAYGGEEWTVATPQTFGVVKLTNGRYTCIVAPQSWVEQYMTPIVPIVPFVPPFEVGDIIVTWPNNTRIVGDVNDDGATLLYPSDCGVEGTFTWHALENNGWNKIGETTP